MKKRILKAQDILPGMTITGVVTALGVAKITFTVLQYEHAAVARRCHLIGKKSSFWCGYGEEFEVREAV